MVQDCEERCPPSRPNSERPEGAASLGVHIAQHALHHFTTGSKQTEELTSLLSATSLAYDSVYTYQSI